MLEIFPHPRHPLGFGHALGVGNDFPGRLFDEGDFAGWLFAEFVGHELLPLDQRGFQSLNSFSLFFDHPHRCL